MLFGLFYRPFVPVRENITNGSRSFLGCCEMSELNQSAKEKILRTSCSEFLVKFVDVISRVSNMISIVDKGVDSTITVPCLSCA